MRIVLINPPNCGRSIPEEQFGISSLKMIFRGEPLALEALAGNLAGHDVEIIDLKVNPDGLDEGLAKGSRPDIIGFTSVTCEAATVLKLATKVRQQFKKECPTIVVGGHHASCDPAYFNKDEIDYIVVGLGKLSFRQLVNHLEKSSIPAEIPGVIKTNQGQKIRFTPRKYSFADLVDDRAPRYDLVESMRDEYVMSGVGGKVGFVVTAFGCTHCCSFCSIPSMTGGKYLSHSISSIIRDIERLIDLPLIRFVDANTFGDLNTAYALARQLIEKGINKRIVADVRADTVVNNPELLTLWKEAGLASVVIGFEEIDNARLKGLNKKSSQSENLQALEILAELGIKVIGDFIISPDYSAQDFEKLGDFIDSQPIALPIPSILTPIPGTPLYHKRKHELEITDLDYYTFSNAVLPTKLAKKEFYTHYSDLMKHLHQHITNK